MWIAPKKLGEERNNDKVVGAESKSVQRLRVQLSTGVYTL